jgi:predicted transcriptional regulator
MLKLSAADSSASESEAPDLPALELQHLWHQHDTRITAQSTAPELNAFKSCAANPTAVEFAALVSDALDLESDLLDDSALGRRTGRRTFNVQPATRIETIFSPSELKVLNWMWSRGRAVDRVSMARLVTASNGEGMRRLAIHFGVAYTTFRKLIRSLSTKLAVEIVKQETTHPAIYLVYHYSAILERLRQAGLTGVIHKGSNAWVLVNADSQPAPAQPELTLQELKRKLIALKATALQTTALPLSEPQPNAAAPNALDSSKYQPGAVESRALSNDANAVNLVAPIKE